MRYRLQKMACELGVVSGEDYLWFGRNDDGYERNFSEMDWNLKIAWDGASVGTCKMKEFLNVLMKK